MVTCINSKSMTKEEGKREYELAFVLKAEDISPVAKALKGAGFSIVKEGPLNKVRLAYPIKKENQGFFASYLIEGESPRVADLTKELELNKEVLRFLILTPVKLKETVARKATVKEGAISDKSAEPEKPSYDSGKMLSNEALEKKLEEILK